MKCYIIVTDVILMFGILNLLITVLTVISTRITSFIISLIITSAPAAVLHAFPHPITRSTDLQPDL